jgi:WD40 repeat protein
MNHYPRTYGILCLFMTTAVILPAAGGERSLLTGHAEAVCALTFSRDGSRIASGDAKGTVKVWDASSKECVRTFEPTPGTEGHVSSLVFTPGDAELLCGKTEEGIAELLGEKRKELLLRDTEILRTLFSPDGSLIARQTKGRRGSTSVHQRSFKVPDIPLYTLGSGENPLHATSFNNASTQIAISAYRQNIEIYDLRSARYIQGLKHDDLVYDIAFDSTDRLIASMGDSGTIKIWDVRTGGCVYTLETRHLTHLAFNPTKNELASRSYRAGVGGRILGSSITLWNTLTGTQTNTFDAGCKWVRALTYDPSGTKLASGAGNNIKIWTLSAAEERQDL